MKGNGNSISELFDTLTNNMNFFIEAVGEKKSTLMATDEWTVKDILCHLVCWHENYAANYKALGEHKNPPLFDAPGQQINHDGVKSLRKFSEKVLIQRLIRANDSLKKSIVEKKVPKMTYKKGGRVYKTEDFLNVIARHFATHTKHVKRAK